MRRKKSQHLDNNCTSSNKKKSKENNQTKEIIMEIQDLKDEYKALKDAYKTLLQEKMKHVEELKFVKDENELLKIKIE